MTTEVQTPEKVYDGDGVSVSFAAPFRFLAGTLVVDVIAGDGTVTTLTESTDYSVSGGETDAGGTVVLTSGGLAPNGSKLRIRRSTARKQTADYDTNDTFPAETHEGALDRLSLITQEQDSMLGALQTRGLLVPDGSVAPPLDLSGLSEGDILEYRNGQLQRFDPTGFAGQFYAGGPGGKFVPAAGTGSDGALRQDLASAADLKGMGLTAFDVEANYLLGSGGKKLQQIKAVPDYASPAVADAIADTLYVPEDVNSSIGYGGALTSKYWGPGQVRTTDGNKRARYYSHSRSRPSSIGNQDSIDTVYNGDWSEGTLLAIEKRVTGAGTLGTPATGYLFTNETAAVFCTMESTSGHNEQLNGNEGRTSSVAFRTIVRNYGQGDCMAYNASGFVASTKPGATHWLAQPAVGLFAGDIAAGAHHVYLNPREIICHDNGYDIACVGDVINMNRSNATAGQSEYWSGYRAQSVGSASVNNIISAVGLFKVGLDFAMSFLDFGATKAAISLKAGDRIYFANASSDGQSTTAFNGHYISYETFIGGLNFVVAGGSCFQINAAQVTANGVRLVANAGVSFVNLGNYANDAAAAAANVPVNGLYRNGSQLMIRVA